MSGYFEIEARLQEALEHKMQHPLATFRWLASQLAREAQRSELNQCTRNSYDTSCHLC